MSTFHKPPTVSDDQRAVDIYRKSAEILHSRGYGATSMGDIAETVDLTKGGLYYYIKGKEALLFAIMNFAMDLIEKEVMAPAEVQNDPQERLAILVGNHLRLVLRDPSTMTLLVNEDVNLSPEHRAKIAARKRTYLALLRSTIEAMQRRKAEEGGPEATIADTSLIAFSLIGMIHWTERWYRPEGRLDNEAVIRQMTRLVLHGLIA